MKYTTCTIFILLFAYFAVSAQVNPFPKISKRVQKTPNELSQDLEGLSQYLVEKAETDKEKAWAIYRWITLSIDYDKYAYKNGSKRINRTVADILSRRMAVCFGYATLFKAMCEKVGLKCELVVGYSKGTLTSTPDLAKPDHAWNAVRIDGEWALLDATWGSSLIHAENDFVQRFKEGYFLTTPESFIVNHLPIDPMWQLLDCPIDTEVYRQTPEQIQQHLARTEPCYSYQDSIEHFLSRPLIEQKLQNIKNAYRYNPTEDNRKELVQSYMDYASRLSDQADAYQLTGKLDSFIQMQSQVLEACEQASARGSLFKWQQELYITTLMNQAVALYQQAEELDNTSSASNYKEALEFLEKAQVLLEELPDDFFTGPAKEQCEQYLEVIRPLVVN